jgi:hypothetical protein
MFYAIVDVNELPHECPMFSIIRYNNTKTKVVVKVNMECELSQNNTLYMKDYIENMMQKNDEWKSKNIV